MKIIRLLTSVFLIVILFTSCDFFKESKMLSKGIDSLITEEMVVFEEPEPDSTEIETIVQETEAILVPEEPAGPSVGYGNDRYYMVVGSFLSENLASKYAKKMQNMGYTPQIIYSSSLGFYRVSAQSYNDYTLAINDISSFRNSVTPRAWVHVKR